MIIKNKQLNKVICCDPPLESRVTSVALKNKEIKKKIEKEMHFTNQHCLGHVSSAG